MNLEVTNVCYAMFTTDVGFRSLEVVKLRLSERVGLLLHPCDEPAGQVHRCLCGTGTRGYLLLVKSVYSCRKMALAVEF